MMFMNDEGTMLDSLGEAAFAAFIESMRQGSELLILIGVLLVTAIVFGAFIVGFLPDTRKHDLERTER